MTVLLLAALLALVEPPVEPVTPPGVQLTQAQFDRLTAAAARTEVLEKRLLKLTERLEFIEQRVGLKPLSGGALTPGAPGDRLTLPGRAKRVVNANGRAQKSDLAAHISSKRATVITWWATWCKPCTSPEELARLKVLQKELARHDVDLVSIAVDGLKKVRGDARADNWLYPFWQLNDGHLDMLPERFIRQVGVGLPLFAVIGPDGALKYFSKQALDDDSMRDLVTAVASVCRI
ncbi:MAG: thiol-disulfide isomerase/thioredoxin [Myxococcota bacterium]